MFVWCGFFSIQQFWILSPLWRSPDTQECPSLSPAKVFPKILPQLLPWQQWAGAPSVAQGKQLNKVTSVTLKAASNSLQFIIRALSVTLKFVSLYNQMSVPPIPTKPLFFSPSPSLTGYPETWKTNNVGSCSWQDEPCQEYTSCGFSFLHPKSEEKRPLIYLKFCYYFFSVFELIKGVIILLHLCPFHVYPGPHSTLQQKEHKTSHEKL